MPSPSWYDPPEYTFQSQAEEIDSRGLYGIYETDPDTGKVLNEDRIPDEYGDKDVMRRLYDEKAAETPEYKSCYTLMPLTFDTCCEMAENEYEDGLEDYYDYKYHAEKESQPCDYDDYY